MRVDHIGYAVKDISNARKTMEALGYVFEPIVEDTERNISIAFGNLDGYRVELVSPNRGGTSPVDIVISKNSAMPYHICYKSKSIEEDIERLVLNRFKVTVPLAPAIAFNNKRVVFLYSLSIGLIEIVEE